MVIEYNPQKNIDNIYNEVFEIIYKKKKILSNKTKKINSFKQINIIKIVLCLLICATVSVTLEMYNYSKEITMLIDVFAITYSVILFYNQIAFSKNLKILKKNTTPSKVIIDEYTITDISNNIEIKINIEKISHIIIGKYSVNIISDDLFHLYFPIEIKDKIIKVIKKITKI